MANRHAAYNSNEDTIISPAAAAEPIVPHATNPLGYTSRAIYVGVSGDLTVRFVNDSNDTTFVGVQAGSILPIRVTHVRASSTAGSLVALF